MTRDNFCRHHWDYYLVLEKDFREIERYVAFDLGDDYLYSYQSITDSENSKCFSNEFIKQYQTICSEVDVILKSICKELDSSSCAKNMEQYTDKILAQYPDIVLQKVKMKDIELQPFSNWLPSPNYKSPDWWTPYNKVKHERLSNYREANLKNALNALAALYILEQYLAKYIGDRDQNKDVPDDISKLFQMVNYHTRDTVIGKDSYFMNDNDVNNLINDLGL